MDDGTTTSAAGNIRYVAATNMSIGAISTTAEVSLSASSIIDSGTADTDITADELLLVTTGVADGDGAGTSTNHLELAVAKLAADVDGTGTGGLFVTETGGITIDTASDIAVTRMGVDATTSTITDTGFSDLDSAGYLVLVTTAGSITVNEGDADDTGFITGSDKFDLELSNQYEVSCTADS